MSKFKITNIKAREILDCRWAPTVRAEVYVDNQIIGQADAPTGRSTGSNEASELRDNEERFSGLGVTRAVKNVVPCNCVRIDMAAENMECAFGLNGRVMKDELPTSSELIPLARFYHAPPKGVSMSSAAFSENIAKNI